MTDYSPGLGSSSTGSNVVITGPGGDQATVTGGKLDVNATLDTTGLATDTGQDEQIALAETLQSLTETLKVLTHRLTALASTVANTAQLRVIGSVTVTSAPSTAVTGPITSAQSIAEKAQGGVSFPEKIAVDNLTAIMGNINNVSIS